MCALETACIQGLGVEVWLLKKGNFQEDTWGWQLSVANHCAGTTAASADQGPGGCKGMAIMTTCPKPEKLGRPSVMLPPGLHQPHSLRNGQTQLGGLAQDSQD